MGIYKCKYFKIYELVNPRYLEVYTEEELWEMMQSPMLKVIDYIRENAETGIVINSYHWDKSSSATKDSGLRYNYGSAGSAHRFSLAFDLHPTDITSEELYSWIIKHRKTLRKMGLTRIEAWEHTKPKKSWQKGWVHVDGKPTDIKDDIDIFNV